MANKVVQYKNLGPVTFSRNRRSKSIRISVKPDKSVRVSYPFYTSMKEVQAFLAKSEAWIRDHQVKMAGKQTPYEPGMIKKTRMHVVEFYQGERCYSASTGSAVRIYSPDFQSEQTRDFIEKVMITIYRFEARVLLPPKLNKLARKHGFSFNEVTIRNNKRNWGSCSSKNNISLNLHMMKLPDELIDYILLHELVHTEIKDHSPRFWKKLDQLTQNRARELALEIKKYSTYTF